jgi:hypothetical protein
MLGLVRYFSRIGLFIALVLLNMGALALLFGYVRSREDLFPIAKEVTYSAAMLAVISALIFFLW